jgi:hypothetical protein
MEISETGVTRRANGAAQDVVQQDLAQQDLAQQDLAQQNLLTRLSSAADD